MAAEPRGLPDWHDASAYAPLLGAEPAGLAWEWLRRDEAYCAAAGSGSALDPPGWWATAEDPAARDWGLHAFVDPALPAALARPVWRREVVGNVLVAAASASGPLDDRFDLTRFAAFATFVQGENGAEHWLLAEGTASLRLDIPYGSLLDGPVHLAYDLSGFAALPGPLAALERLLGLWRTGRLAHRPGSPRNRRLVQLLRTHDALRAGTAQREIAEVLLSPEAGRARWRSEAPSLRTRAQRLAAGARTMGSGGYLRLLRGQPPAGQ